MPSAPTSSAPSPLRSLLLYIAINCGRTGSLRPPSPRTTCLDAATHEPVA
jgi:hypothetical protein